MRENPASSGQYGSRPAVGSFSNGSCTKKTYLTSAEPPPVQNHPSSGVHSTPNAGPPHAATRGQSDNLPGIPALARSRPSTMATTPSAFEPLIGSCETANLPRRTTELDQRKNPDSPTVHGSRLSARSSSALHRGTESSQGNKREPLSCDSAMGSREREQIQDKRDAGFEPLLDASESARLLRIHPKTLQRLARVGRVPGYRVGRSWRYRASDLEMWLRSASHSNGQLADRVDFTKENSQ
jgi:excisionase family DNA binding protein